MIKVNYKYIYKFNFFIIELCCSFCYFKNLHKNHRVVEASDENLLKNENITLESSFDKFNEISEKLNLLKNKIEKELNEIDKLYDKVNKELTKSFEIKHEKLIKEENDLKENLKNEVTKIKETLENNLSESYRVIKYNEKINKGIKNLEKEEDKNNIRILSYISKINKTKNEINSLNQKLMKNIKISFDEKNNNIDFKEYYFNGIPTPKEVEFKDINDNGFKISWKIEDLNMFNFDNKQINYKVEIRKEDSEEKYKQYYEGNGNNCSIEGLKEDTQYEIRICCCYNDVIGSWSEIKKIKTNYLNLNDSLIIKDEDDKKKKICEWINPNKKIDFKLLFRMSRDGSNCSDFHRLCDNKGETLLLFKTTKNYIFGAYTPLSWTSSSSGEVNDPNDSLTFLFSLNKMQKYAKIKGNTARSQTCNGPLLGSGTDIGIYDNMKKGWTNNGSFLKERELTNGEDSFELSEIEIFKVLYN